MRKQKKNRERNAKRRILFVALIGIVFLGTIGIVKCSIQAQVEKLEDYENDVINQYATNGILANRSQCIDVLDLVENYISDNQHKLGIASYERSDSSIEVKFAFGFTHLFIPTVSGYD